MGVNVDRCDIRRRNKHDAPTQRLSYAGLIKPDRECFVVIAREMQSTRAHGQVTGPPLGDSPYFSVCLFPRADRSALQRTAALICREIVQFPVGPRE